MCDFRFSEVNMAPSVGCIYFLVLIFAISNVNSSNDYYTSAIVESCSGCRLNWLPDVKNFIFEDLPNYNKVEFKHIRGAEPELVLFDRHNEEVERLPLSRLTREECNNLLITKGFTKKAIKDEM
ncbi:selenoprotein M-like isoform X1 [Colletes gigas]|uniref:selenoprotein M-like isoform X1 n=2 Tax=Colletes gigas TaxID=935657 RepID=UPI001C9A3191|nr:selenoprotein M-like isoform X1 [Colletes gigas]